MKNIEIYVNKYKLAKQKEERAKSPIYHNSSDTLELLVNENFSHTRSIKRQDFLGYAGVTMVSAAMIYTAQFINVPILGVLTGLGGALLSLVSATGIWTSLSINKDNRAYYLKLPNRERVITNYFPSIIYNINHITPVEDLEDLTEVKEGWGGGLYLFNNVELKCDMKHEDLEITEWKDLKTNVVHRKLEKTYSSKYNDINLSVNIKVYTDKEIMDIPLPNSEPIYIIGKLTSGSEDNEYTLTPIEWGPASYKLTGHDSREE